jgi:pimeloyl-ACP methyl ester carboxylesterase
VTFLGDAVETYIDVQGHPTWISDDRSDLPPILLLHGGLLSSASSWSDVPDRLREHHRVLMFDRRGHGHTADTPEPFHYRSMAQEAAAVIEALEIAPVNAVGYSDGANLLLHLALDRPELLRSMVLISGNFHHDALYHDGEQMLDSLDEVAAALYAEYPPDGAEHWPIVAAKGLKMGFHEEPTFSPEDLAPISMPTLVLAGDDDMFPAAHTVSMFDALPNAQLAILPGTSHLVVFEQPALVAELVDTFFATDGKRHTLAPMRRTTS